ncbi:helix-turn-helix domain-containing protein [Sphingobacterium endophyticum]|uniref:helix-turn-helix domain-containing protein n=1 Tax=Sphingobacterium endophyticum TaxID=2546448 RepID=UPI0012E18AE7|nr:helix-turn-helix transcriptional regulator [Sphingobacterium endophyticum]
MERTQHIHEGRNIKRFREMLGMKQEALAFELGEDWTQKKVSQLEAKEKIETDILEQVAKILKVPAEAIQNFDVDQAVNIISNTFNDQSNGYNYYPNFHFNPVDKMIELYERMLQQQKEMIDKLEKLLSSKN